MQCIIVKNARIDIAKANWEKYENEIILYKLKPRYMQC